MSTAICQIIEVRRDGRWERVPLSDDCTDDNECLEMYGSVRDMFAGKWYDSDKFMNSGVPDDISKEAREAMVYRDEDFISCGACWISMSEYESLSESLRQKVLADIERLVAARRESRVSDRLRNIEKMVSEIAGKVCSSEDAEDDESESECYIREDLEDHMFAWEAAERNIAEIGAYVNRFTGDWCPNCSDVRVVMYVSC